MDRMLTSITTIKLTHQAHTQLLAQLVNSAQASSPGLQGLPDLPFGTLADPMEWEAHLVVPCHFLYAGSLTEERGSKEQATLKDIEKASMSWFRHATERAAAEQKGTRASPVDELI
ncbi:hypothetical protein HPB48_013420 [Haemaphysalis longicornis]|uniref:Uncharacterized protein n=1 Tax=Haemaphysalis longicornis TaxID=44386 RepID=A0A9J6FBX1_HAELO|nr:hypothetical protein HPB48_013420 [Haemaphysalis longicornis]